MIVPVVLAAFFSSATPPTRTTAKQHAHTHSPWKELQINYLKSLQAGDLRLRRQRYPTTNAMFLAYEVKPAHGAVMMQQPLLLPDQLKNAYFLPQSDGGDGIGGGGSGGDGIHGDYVRGDLLGFVEITQRRYGIGTASGRRMANGSSGGSSSVTDPADETTTETYCWRPVLTNLSVAREVRKGGIGSRLLEACERHVRTGWNLNEIVLEVEDFNDAALRFYTKRGFHVLFSDPASRRYDVSGFFIKKVRCRREVLRKVLHGGSSLDSSSVLNFDIFRRIRDGFRL
jgi:ribosomal protein S18 acetylase RimI-like enzyme